MFLPKHLFKFGGIFAVVSSISVIVGGISGFPFYKFSLFQGDVLSLSLIVLTGAFGLLISLYTLGHFEDYSNFFWLLFCWLLSSSCAVFVSQNIIVLLISWGITGLVLAIMLFQAGNKEVFKKTFIMVGASDAIMLLGLVAMMYVTKGNTLLGLSIKLDDPFSWTIFISLLIASFTKAGAMPFHTWIPDTSEVAPAPIVALLPASLDKLLGIYLLKKIVVDWFIIPEGGNFILLAVGALTIIAAVFMALSQHNLKRLLGYHAVSQVGYMVMGLGTGNPIGIAGGLLHMVNNAIYKQSLFLNAGVIEKQTGTSELEGFGGLFKNFPITFVSFTIGAMAISGVPPFNGFVSKWLVYQGVVEIGKNSTNPLWVLWLTAAVFGSALTLASFVKIIHSVFLGQPAEGRQKHFENLRWELPALIGLPLACIIIGIFPEWTVYPILDKIVGPLGLPGLWQPQLAVALLLIGVGVGVLFYLIYKVGGYRVSETYIGGEKITPAMRVPGVEFYATIENLRPFNKIYSLARKGYFDIYELLKGFTFYWIRLLRWLHSGILSHYILWVLVGSAVLFFTIFR